MRKVKIVLRSASQKDHAKHIIDVAPYEPLMQIEYGPYTEKRSSPQNRLMWAWMAEIRNHILETTGDVFTAEQIQNAMKQRFLSPAVKSVLGQEIVEYRSNKLSKQEFTEFLGNVEMYCARDLGLILARPDEYDEVMRDG